MIRECREEELEQVADIADRAFSRIVALTRRKLGDRIQSLLRPDGDARSKGMEVRRRFAEHPETVWVCEEEGRIVGFITFDCDRERRIGTIGNNGVDPACGLKGIGQQMYRAVLDYFRREGMLAARVFTGLKEEYIPARRAYERAGFDRTLTHVTYFMEL